MPAKRTFPERMDLVDTKISRGGVTSNYSKTESCKVSCWVTHSKKVLSIQFDIASKGGGQTGIDVQIGIQDLANILRSVAEYMPEIGTTLSECAAIASNRNIRLLAEARAELQELGAAELLPSRRVRSEKYFILECAMHDDR